MKSAEHPIIRTPPRLRHGGGARAQQLIEACPSLKTPYEPPRWASNPHVQVMLFMANTERDPPPRWDRVERLIMPDGGTIGVAWHGLWDTPDVAPTLVILPTITGCSTEFRGVAQRMHDALGWAVAICDRRGHGSLPLTAPSVNTFGRTDDLRRQLEAIEAVRPHGPLYGLGISAGGGLLVRYLGEEGERSRIRAGILHSPGYDIETVFHRTSPFYNRIMTRRLIAYFLRRHQRVLSHVRGFEACANARTLPEFHDNLYPLAGFHSREAYFDASNPMGVAYDIKVPLLLLNAEDDPVCHIDVVEEHAPGLLDALEDSILAVTQKGSHCAFYQGPQGRESWAEQVMVEFLQAADRLDRSASRLVTAR